MSTEKSEAQKLKEALFLERKHGGLKLPEEEIRRAEWYCEDYKKFLDSGKTEREVVTTAIAMAEKQGYEPYEYGRKYTAGDKVYLNNRGKSIVFALIGSDPIENGVNIMASHIDSPRIDLKVNPVYEDGELCLFKTHYYGGVKKYQWTAMPLALHGVVVRQDGVSVTVSVGEDENDPVFCVTDLLPHLSADQMKRTLGDGIRGEELNLLVGSYPYRDEEISQAIKLNILRILNEKYGMVEKDFRSAELSIVPAFKARDLGFDRSMVAAYGQDDRVCAYTSLTALLHAETPGRTLVCVLADKEETGSGGTTGMNADYWRNLIAGIARPYGVDARQVFANSKCLSADVNIAFDPTFPEVHEKMNVSFANYGVVLTKYTGARGKAGTSDASAEFTGEIQRMLDANGVLWQTGNLGKVDQGGGGTVAGCLAQTDIDTIDIGVPVLSMHAPLEVAAKIDVYSTYRAFCAFAKHEG